MAKDKPEAKCLCRKLQEHNGQYNLNIPRSIALSKGWQTGDILKIIINKKGNLEINKNEAFTRNPNK